MRCFACGGPFHPASGHAWMPDVVYCGRCIRSFYDWVRTHTRPWRPRKGDAGPPRDFYGEAATSIRAKAKDDART
jgi:hypothetical protein